MATNKDSDRKWWDFIKKPGKSPSHLGILLVLTALGVALLIIGNDKGKQINSQIVENPTTEKAGLENSSSIEELIEQELGATLEAIEGVGTVRVKLSLKSKNRNIWERQAQTNKRSTQEQGMVNTEETVNDELVFAKDPDGWDRPIIKEELAPVIQGVIVVAEGADDIRIRRMLTDTVMTILEIPAHRVRVLPGSSKREGN